MGSYVAVCAFVGLKSGVQTSLRRLPSSRPTL